MILRRAVLFVVRCDISAEKSDRLAGDVSGHPLGIDVFSEELLLQIVKYVTRSVEIFVLQSVDFLVFIPLKLNQRLKFIQTECLVDEKLSLTDSRLPVHGRLILYSIYGVEASVLASKRNCLGILVVLDLRARFVLLPQERVVDVK